MHTGTGITAREATESQEIVRFSILSTQIYESTRLAENQRPNPGPISLKYSDIVLPDSPDSLTDVDRNEVNAIISQINVLSAEQIELKDRQNYLLINIQTMDKVDLNTNKVNGVDGFSDIARKIEYTNNDNRITDIDIEMNLLINDLQTIIGQ